MTVFVGLLVTLSLVCATTNNIDLTSYAQSDELIQNLLSNTLGRTNSGFKTLFRVQNGAFELLSSMRGPLTKKQKDKFLKMLDVASKANNVGKVIELLGKILYTVQSTESRSELTKIVLKYAARLNSSLAKGTSKRDADPFDPIFKHLHLLDGGATLIFAIDTTGSMSEDIKEAQTIASDITNMNRQSEVNYILSPFNDPGTGPITTFNGSEKNSFLKEIGNLRVSGGGDCSELAFKAMQESLDDVSVLPSSSMFVFTDAAPKDATSANIENVVDTAGYLDTTRISFFLDKNMCGSTTEIDKFRKVAADTGGEVFELAVSKSGGRKRRSNAATRSNYSPFVSQSLRGISRVTSKVLNGAGLTSVSKSISTTSSTVEILETYTSTTLLPTFSSNKPQETKFYDFYEKFEIDDDVSYLSVVVNYKRRIMNDLYNPKNAIVFPSSEIDKSVVYEISDPIPGTWKLALLVKDTHSNYQISVAFKKPIAFDVKFFYMERPNKLMIINRPMMGETQKLMITMVGSDKVDPSSLMASLVDMEGRQLLKLSITSVAKGNLKLTANFTSPKVPFRVKLVGKTKKGAQFQRETDQVIRPSSIIFKTIYAADEYSVPLGKTGSRIMNLIFIKQTTRTTVTFNAKARYGTVTSISKFKRIRRRGFNFLIYNAPKDPKYRGKSDHVIVEASYGGNIATHRISILLM